MDSIESDDGIYITSNQESPRNSMYSSLELKTRTKLLSVYHRVYFFWNNYLYIFTSSSCS